MAGSKKLCALVVVEAVSLHFPNKLFGKFVAIRYLTGTVSCPTSSAPAAPHLRRGTPRPPRGMASTPQRPPPPQRPPDPKSLLLGRPRNRSLRHLRGPEPPTRRLQPILPRKPSRTAAGRAEERRRGRGDRSAAEEAIEHPLVSAVPEQPLGALFRALFIIYHHISNSPYHRAIVAR